MLTIIHGSDTAASRKYFNDQKQHIENSITLEADAVTITDLMQILEGGGLFGENKYIFIEQFITKKKKSTDFKTIATYLSEKSQENTIVLWEGKELEPAHIKSIKNATTKIFKLPQTLFQLLDAIKPGNSTRLISLFHQTIDNAEPEMVFSMLTRHFRILLALSEKNTDNPIDEVQRMKANPNQQWILTKMSRQAAQFTPEHLEKLYRELFLIEVGQKTGSLSTNIVTAIDFFLLEV